MNPTAGALEFSRQLASGKRITVCKINLETDRLELFLQDEKGAILKTFAAVERFLEPKGRTLSFAMNAGMFHGNFAPVGLFVQDGRQINPLNLDNAPGNFFLKPNGVFLVSASGARVIESSEYLKLEEPSSLATQSGPLLLRANQLHPAFNAGSMSRLYRNGVGVASKKTVYFAISEEQVNLYEFAVFFRDVLHCPDALYLDGDISSLFAPALRRNDDGNHLGPIVGVSAPRQ
ncbi:MAG: periplasmic protein-like protein [Chthoniobacteraceae bacterium]|nr:periplasmic protein-like protein [Chthoniobacteraceae bacterium]